MVDRRPKLINKQSWISVRLIVKTVGCLGWFFQNFQKCLIFLSFLLKKLTPKKQKLAQLLRHVFRSRKLNMRGIAPKLIFFSVLWARSSKSWSACYNVHKQRKHKPLTSDRRNHTGKITLFPRTAIFWDFDLPVQIELPLLPPFFTIITSVSAFGWPEAQTY